MAQQEYYISIDIEADGPIPGPNSMLSGVVIFNDIGCVLMGIRKGAHAAGTWSFPGGWMDYEDSSLEATGRRELREETNVFPYDQIPPLYLFATSSEEFPDQKPPFRTVTVYLTSRETVQGAPKVQVMEPEKCQLWAWIDPRAKDFGPVFAGIPQMWDLVIQQSEAIRKSSRA